MRENEKPNGVSSAGFTLVELLVVLAVVAVLLSILIPSLRKARVTAFRAGCASNLRQINLGLNMYLDDSDGIYPCAEDPVSVEPVYWLWMGRGWRGAVEPFLGQTLDAENPSVLFCKSDDQAEEKYESTSYAYSMCFYHSPRQIDAMTSAAATYSNPQPSVGQRVGDVGEPDRKVLAGEWTSNHERVADDKGWWAWVGSRNFLFADGHTTFLSASSIHPANDGNPNPCLTRSGIKGRDAD